MKTLQKAVLRGAVVMFALGMGTAQAQGWSDQPVTWSGPYIGAVGGVGWGTSKQGDDGGFGSGHYFTKGGMAGGEAGYNWQVQRLVVGLEGDMSWSEIGGHTVGTGAIPCGGGNDPNCSTHLDDLGTVRGRLGLNLGPLMPYATGGLAFGQVRAAEGYAGDSDAYGSGSTYRTGWAAGAGLEVAVFQPLSVKLEYLHVDLGRGPAFTDSFGDGSTASENVDFHSDMVRAGVALHF